MKLSNNWCQGKFFLLALVAAIMLIQPLPGNKKSDQNGQIDKSTGYTITNIRKGENSNLIKFITIINPIRSRERWNNKSTETLNRQILTITDRNLNATWLVQYDNLYDEEVINLLKSQNSTQEIGAFLEVSEKWATDARVKYKIDEGDYYRPDKAFLSGYSRKERKKLIDTYFKKFNKVFNYSPRIVGAWYIDAYSNRLLAKLNVSAALTLSDQFDTDAASIWGKYFAMPYYPASLNPLEPASDPNNKIPIVTVQWAQRDLVASYGKEIKHSRQSLQANDYIANGYSTDYFLKLLENYLSSGNNDFVQVTIGLEAGQEADKYADEFDSQIDIIANMQKSEHVNVPTLSNFAQWYKTRYPGLSPSHFLSKDKNFWYMTPQFRLAIFNENDKYILKDLRFFNNLPFDDYYLKDTSSYLLKNTSAKIDEVKYSNQKDFGKSAEYEIEIGPEKFLLTLDNSKIEVTNLGLKVNGNNLLVNTNQNQVKSYRKQLLKENIEEMLEFIKYSRIEGETFVGIASGENLYGLKGKSPGKYQFNYQVLSRFKSPADLLR